MSELYATRREIAPGIFWLGGCDNRPDHSGAPTMHGQASTFLVVGPEKALMYDTGTPGDWTMIQSDLQEILGGRTLDFVVPSHSELPHSGNLAAVLNAYPACRAIGDVRDYHLFYPEHASRLDTWPLDKPIALGGRKIFILLAAPIKDLVTTVWGYESSEQVMFVADAFGYLHHRELLGDDDQPLHHPGECRKFSSELYTLPEVEHAQHLTRGALSWTGYMDAGKFLETVQFMFLRYPTKFVAPTHGNVIDDMDQILPIMKEAYSRVYRGEGAKAPA